jgi:hypothetical protein
MFEITFLLIAVCPQCGEQYLAENLEQVHQECSGPQGKASQVLPTPINK